MISTASVTLSFVNGSPTFFGGQSGIRHGSADQCRWSRCASFRRSKSRSRITQNQAKIAGFNDMKAGLTAMSSALNGLRNPPGFFGSQDNVFEAKSVFLSGGGVDPTSRWWRSPSTEPRRSAIWTWP